MKDRKRKIVLESVLIITIITIVGLCFLKFVGAYLTDAVTKSSCNLVGKIYKEGESAGNGSCIDSEPEKTKEVEKEE